ncbi:MAG: hypothetical protein J6Y20_10110 [Lachnospiraceae bacterium]|nr:hypothetical protein [Lachnospiraceae bacterium]MBP5462467.1 hypothetical protein [Lachnospiraceae bacterium]
MYKWSVVYQFHAADESYHVDITSVNADSIGEAVKIFDSYLSDCMDDCGWSDYHITCVELEHVEELH